jgi:hypothetical protein
MSRRVVCALACTIVSAVLKHVLLSVQEVSDAAYFLPAFDLRQATLALGALRELHEAAATALQPRKRFAFSRKASKPGAAAEAAEGPSLGARCGAGSCVNEPAAAAVASSQQPQPLHDTQQPAQGVQQGAAGGPSSSGAGSAISGLRGKVLSLGRGEAAGKEFTLTDLEDCSIYLLAPLAALFLHGLRRCRVYTGPVAGACFVEGTPPPEAWVPALFRPSCSDGEAAKPSAPLAVRR